MNRANIILISIDDLRFDCIGCEENKSWLRRYDADTLVDTPNIDWFAARGARFSQCVSVSSYTPAPHASMLTGTYPFRHGVKTFLSKLSSRVATLPEILSKYGYESFAVIEHFALGALGITRGSLLVDNRLEDEDRVFHHLTSQRGKGYNTFVFIHVMDVHSPYCFATGTVEDQKLYNKDYLVTMKELVEASGLEFEPLFQDAKQEARRTLNDFDKLAPPLREWAEVRALNHLWRNHLRRQGRVFEEVVPLYVEGVSKFDKGKFADLILKLTEADLLTEESLLIITSDHGESRCKWDGREDFMNSFHLTEGALRIPLILHSPRNLPAKVIDGPVSLVDIVPTVLDFLQISHVTSGLDGQSLLPMIKGETKVRNLFSETWAYRGGINQFGQIRQGHECFRRQMAVRGNKYKYIETGEVVTSNDMAAASNQDFVKTLYRKILGRFENEHELAYWSKVLDNHRITRQELSDRFAQKMGELNLKTMLFDLCDDPWEETNLAGCARYGDTMRKMEVAIRGYKHAERISESARRLRALHRL